MTVPLSILDADASPPPRADGSLLISETFTSIQGEGKLTGVPSWFARLSGCNLRCGWCDTPYASWKPEGTTRTIDDLLREARAAAQRGVGHAVLTGGEPMLFRGLCELSTRLAAPVSEGGAGMHISIETAGTVIPTDDRWPLTCHLMSISPKLSTSTPNDDPRDTDGTWAKRHEQRRLNIPVLQSLIDAHPQFQLKFVVCDPCDLDEIESLLGQLRRWNPSDVLLMPEGVAPPTPAARAMVADACVQRGFRYCARLHIELYGNTRGT